MAFLPAGALLLAAFAAPNAQPPRPDTVPLYADLGAHHVAISTTVPRAQLYFDQGMRLVYAFNHGEAIRAFDEAARLDTNCAICHWGAALAFGPHVNAPMDSAAGVAAWAELQQAVALAPKASAKEQAFINALRARYAAVPPANRASLDSAYATAMADVVRKYPDDLDAATLHAEAIMDTMPWNYWLPEGRHQPLTPELLATLERVLVKDPNHPGANHLYIHAVEAGPTPAKGLASADRLRDIAPGAGHLVHMPAHIYLRLGMYQMASRANEEAIEADREYLNACRRQGLYPAMYYPHNIHFLWYSSGIEGRSAESIRRAREAASYIKSRCCADVDISQRPLPLLALSRFGRWEEVLKEPPAEKDHTFDQIIWNYARGVAFTYTGQIEQAIESKRQLDVLAASDEAKKLENPYLPASQIFAREELGAEIARRQGRPDEWISGLHSAVAAQDKLPYMEPPYWYYPTRHNLGAALVELKRFAEAEGVYREDLKRHPHNGRSLFGLVQALRGQGKTDAADQVQREFELAWIRADVKLTNSRY
jgi:tetratricopeptide (TPR) repeat protein